MGFGDVRNSPVRIFVAFAIKLDRRHVHNLGQRNVRNAELRSIDFLHHLRELSDGYLVSRASDVENLTLAYTVWIDHDAIYTVNGVVDISVAPALGSSVDELDRHTFKQRIHKEAEDARNTLLFTRQKIDFGSYEIKRSDNRVVESFFQPVSMQNAFEQLFRTGIDPAMLRNRAQDQFG